MKLIDRYASFVAHHPYIILTISLLLIVISMIASQNIKTENMDYKNMLPEGDEVIEAFEILEDKFGGSDTALIAVESEDDIRDPETIRYINILSSLASRIDDVTGVTSASTLIENTNKGYLPKSKREIIDLCSNNPLIPTYISDDYKMTLIKISLSDDSDEEEIAEEIQKIIKNTPRPRDVTANIAGESMTNPVVNAQMSDDMGRTSQLSLLSIIVILLILFRSIRFGFTPLATIGVGVIWAFGYIGIMGLNMSSATSGVISMIMGIGIDFGIQTVTRYRQELKKSRPEKAIKDTISNVAIPMMTTTLAALIGFKAMSMGNLTLMEQMGTMMSYGVTACFLAAITVVPSLLIITENISIKKIIRFIKSN